MFKALAIVVFCLASGASERWEALPNKPEAVAGAKSGFADVNGIKLYYATTGHDSPVVLLHGGRANSDYWGFQAMALAPTIG